MVVFKLDLCPLPPHLCCLEEEAGSNLSVIGDGLLLPALLKIRNIFLRQLPPPKKPTKNLTQTSKTKEKTKPQQNQIPNPP